MGQRTAVASTGEDENVTLVFSGRPLQVGACAASDRAGHLQPLKDQYQ